MALDLPRTTAAGCAAACGSRGPWRATTPAAPARSSCCSPASTCPATPSCARPPRPSSPRPSSLRLRQLTGCFGARRLGLGYVASHASTLNSMRIVDVHHRVHLQLASQLQVLVPRKRRSLSWRQRLCGWVASVRSLPCEQSIWVGIRTTRGARELLCLACRPCCRGAGHCRASARSAAAPARPSAV